MFSGFIVHSGTALRSVRLPHGGVELHIALEKSLAAQIKPADSVCINGVCLTATHVHDADVIFDVVPETLARSSLTDLQEGEPVNLELALRVGDRIAGHFVYGHIDRCVNVVAASPEGSGMRLSFEVADALRPFIVEKGFVAIDGISLTVAAVSMQAFQVAVIPETLRRTTLARRRPGSCVNIEVDPLARYVVAALRNYDQRAATSEELAWAYEI
ncbi:MAG: riboflavin synthase [Candidatus Eremiobacteraeota bacterium]|nr:riboflavin synthase [Candidatus Eremiobacteraeota bacterium]